MSREIEFRFWKHKVMCRDFDGFNESLGINEMFVYCRENGYPVMQYTGLKDKNGVKIFEGDLLSYGDQPSHYVYEVRFSDTYGQWLGCNELYVDVKAEKDAVTVIGNIYESPELLEQDNDK